MGRFSKITGFLVIFVLLSASLAQNGTSYTPPALRSTINSRSLTSPVSQNQLTTRRGTQPVSSYRNSLLRSPNTINNYGNLIVTGNVGGGKHFRGTVPYNAVSDFGGRLGSGTLDNFLRRSAISQDYSTGGLTPYYSYTGTVTRVQPGTNLIATPQSTRIRTDLTSLGGANFITTPQVSRQTASTSNLTATGKMIFLPIGVEDESEIDFTSTPQQRQEIFKRKEYDLELNDFNKRLEQLRNETEELQRQLKQDSAIPQEQIDEDEERIDISEQMMKEYQEQKEIYDELFPEEAEKENQYDPNVLKVRVGDRKLKYDQTRRTDPEPGRETQKTTKEKDMSPEAIEARARVVEQDFDSFESETNTKYQQLVNSAQENMKNGRFYKAANDYSYATLYKPTEPDAYAGKSHALFAAGEYVSSALNINMAVKLSPDFADKRVDIVSLIGNRDTVEKRLADIDNWYGVTSSPELKFLQAYIYMQIDRLDKAKEAVTIAKKEMSDVPAVNTLAEAIEKRGK